MYFRLNLKMKKSTLCYCFTWIVFIELNFRVAFLLIRETWDDGFASKMKGGGGGWGILRKGGGIVVMGKGLIPLHRLCLPESLFAGLLFQSFFYQQNVSFTGRITV